MMKKGVSLLMKYNDSGNSTVDFFNATDGLGEYGLFTLILMVLCKNLSGLIS